MVFSCYALSSLHHKEVHSSSSLLFPTLLWPLVLLFFFSNFFLTGFVDWLDRGLIYICIREKNLEMCTCIWPEFDCLEETLCGWQDFKIQLLLLLLDLFCFCTTNWIGFETIQKLLAHVKFAFVKSSKKSWSCGEKIVLKKENKKREKSK